MRGMAALRSITRGGLRVIFLLHVDRQYILVNRKVQMWLSLCCIHVIIKYYELRKYTNEKNGKQSIKSNE